MQATAPVVWSLTVLVALAPAPPADPAAPAPRPLPDRNPLIAPEDWTRHAHGAAVLGGRIYLAGGAREGGSHAFHERVDALDLAERRWLTVADLPTPRAFPAVVAEGSLLYVIGGLAQQDAKTDRPSGVVERFDPRTNTWESLPPLPTPRSRLAAVAVGGMVYAIGGMEAAGGVVRDSAVVERYDPAARVWARCADLPTPRHALAAAAIDGKVYAMGGYCLEQALSPRPAVEVLDPASGVWSAGPPMTAPRAWFAAVPVSRAIIAIGGAAEPERLDVGEGRWTLLQVPDAPGRRFAAVPAEGLVWVFGGEGGGPIFVRVLDPGSLAWLPASGAPAP